MQSKEPYPEGVCKGFHLAEYVVQGTAGLNSQCALLMFAVGPMITKAENDTVIPQFVFEAAGVVIELGAGNGNQTPRFDPSKVAKIYGVEPVADLHDQLRASIKKAKLDDVYTVVPCGIENTIELRKYGIEPESIDTIISISVMCSVAQPEGVAHQLYSLLKPGGKLIFYEHVRSPDFFSRQVQRKPKRAFDLKERRTRNTDTKSAGFYNIFWPYALGNCHLDRETEKYLLNAGKWVEVDMQHLDVDDASKILPRIAGHLTK